jgi:hypothetical protein
MSDRPPVDLRALADVEAPEVVHEALRRFRRKILTRYVWILLAAVIAVVAVVWAQTPTTLAERTDQASRAIEAHPVWQAHGATVALDRVASLGDGRLGFHFVVIGRGLVTLRMSGQVATENVGWANKYVEIERPAQGYPTLTIVAGEGRSSFSLGPGSGVTEAVWSL